LSSFTTIAVKIILVVARKAGTPRSIDERAGGGETQEKLSYLMLCRSGAYHVQESNAVLFITSLKIVDLPGCGRGAWPNGNDTAEASTLS
jgi:hypothetical protein